MLVMNAAKSTSIVRQPVGTNHFQFRAHQPRRGGCDAVGGTGLNGGGGGGGGGVVSINALFYVKPSKVEHFYFVTRANRGFTCRGGQAADDDDF
jgi:hypothetical protein